MRPLGLLALRLASEGWRRPPPTRTFLMLIGYARVSTTDQNLTLQRDALAEAGCEKIFTEHVSGAAMDRPALLEALKSVREGDTLVVWKLDRLARSVRQLIDTVDRLQEKGAAFRSLTEALETTTPQGRLVFHMFGALAEFERSLIRERTLAGLAAARREGRIGGQRAKMAASDIAAAEVMLADPTLRVATIARRFGVSVPTFYRYVPAARLRSGVSFARQRARRQSERSKVGQVEGTAREIVLSEPTLAAAIPIEI